MSDFQSLNPSFQMTEPAVCLQLEPCVSLSDAVVIQSCQSLESTGMELYRHWLFDCMWVLSAYCCDDDVVISCTQTATSKQ